MFDINPKIWLKSPELFILAGIITGYFLFLPRVFLFYDVVPPEVFVALLILFHTLLLYLCMRLLRLYEQRAFRDNFHQSVRDLHTTMARINELAGLTLKAQRQLLKTIQQFQKIQGDS